MSQVQDSTHLKKRIGVARGQLTRLLKKVQEALDDREVDTRKLKQLESSLKEQKLELEKPHYEIQERLHDEDETEEVCDEKVKGADDIMEKLEITFICLGDTEVRREPF